MKSVQRHGSPVKMYALPRIRGVPYHGTGGGDPFHSTISGIYQIYVIYFNIPDRYKWQGYAQLQLLEQRARHRCTRAAKTTCFELFATR